MQPILTLENLSKFYVNGKNVVTGLNRISLSFHRGEFVAVTGQSGSGKSTLAHVLAGILPYEEGELLVDGLPTSHYGSGDWEGYRRDRVAFISQNYGILPGATVEDNVLSALCLSGMPQEEASARAEEILNEVELGQLRRRRAAKLSSGQKQRLAIARALAKPCPILIADEPTGNLDPENSQKVIRLLARAAQERLVILITHEFSEAEALVTRHIRIHDGRVVGDASLRDAVEVGELPAPRKAEKLGRYTARLQLRSRPVWASLVLLFFALTAFGVFAFLGSFTAAADDTSTRIYDDSAFQNGDPTRIVAVRKDGAAMTEEDYQTILSLRRVETLERYGYVADLCYAWQEGTDYAFSYTVINVGSSYDPEYMTVQSPTFLRTDRFVQTVPLGASGFLEAGRLPASCYEVVAADASLLGQTVTVYLRDAARWSDTAYLKLDVTVVGVTDHGEGLYFSDQLAAALTLNVLGQGAARTLLPWDGEVPEPMEYQNYYMWEEKSIAETFGSYCGPYCAEVVTFEDTAYRPLAQDEAIVGFWEYKSALALLYNANISSPTYDEIYETGVTVYGETLKIATLHDSTLNWLVFVTGERFDAWVAENLAGCGDQVSMTISDYAYTDRVLTALDEAGYYALSPYVLGSAKVDSELAAQRMQTLTVCLAALVVVIFLQLLLLRALFAVQNESYRLLSNVGLTWQGARRSVWVQIFAFTAAGQLLALAAVLLCGAFGVERVAVLLRCLRWYHWLAFAAVHLAASSLAALGVLRGLKKRVSPASSARPDLEPRRKEAAL